jgi:hypothetical protein
MKILFRLCILLLSPTMALARPADVKTLEKPKALYEIPRKNLYAIGLTAVPSGLITIINGNIHVARTDGAGKLSVDSSMKTVAQKLVYTVISSWIEVPIVVKVQTADALSAEISKALGKLGFENARGIPFLLKGKFRRVEAHVTETSKLSGDGLSGIALGLFTKTSAARVKPETYSLVWNFVSDDLSVVGSVDTLTFEESDHVTLFLPR